MYLGTFKLTTSDTNALVRIDLLENGAQGLYHLTDADGQEHTWTFDLTSDTDSETFEERGRFALVAYLQDCGSKGWAGLVTPVQVATGLEFANFAALTNVWNLDCSAFKPEGVSLQ